MTKKREIKPIFVSHHALSRLRQRSIDFVYVKRALREPDLKAQVRHGRLKALKKIDGRELAVI